MGAEIWLEKSSTTSYQRTSVKMKIRIRARLDELHYITMAWEREVQCYNVGNFWSERGGEDVAQ